MVDRTGAGKDERVGTDISSGAREMSQRKLIFKKKVRKE